MGSFQASILEAFQSLREELTAKKQTEVDQTSVSASKPGTSSTAVNLDLPPPRHRTNIQTEDMDVDYGPALSPHLGPDPHDTSDQYVAPSELPPKKVSDKPKKHSYSRSRHEIESRSASDQSNEESDEPWIPSTKPKKHSDKSKHKSRSRYVSSSSEEDQSSVARHRSSKPSGAREVALSDIPSQYAEEVDTFRWRILSLPNPRESMPRSSTSVMGLDDEKGRQELRPRGPSSILPLSSVIKDAFDKFQHDFKAANLPEGKYIKPPPSTSKWYRVGQPCYQDKYQELNTDFAKICITPKPSGAPMGKVPPTKNWSIRLGKISQPSISPLPLLKLHLLAMLPLRSVNIVLSQLSRRLRHRSRKVPILVKQQSADMRKSVSTWIFGRRQFLFNTGPLHASANP